MADRALTPIGNPLAQLDLPEGLTRALIDLVRDIGFAALPEQVRRRAKHSLMDPLGVIALGSAAEPVRMLRRVVAEPCGREGVTVFGTERGRAAPLDAAMINGLAGHVRDFDDAGAGGHVSAIIVPAALALAEQADATGADVLSAPVAGYETAFRVNRLLGQSHYYLGFHSSGTVGTFAATAAACRLLGLPRDGWAMAFGIAGSLAGGLLANFGSMTKPLHAANAARAGVLAAMLAGSGFTGSAQVLEHAAGFVQTHTVRSDSSAALCPLGEPWALSDMIYKFNAACSGTHSGGDGVRRLAGQHGVTADDVARITIRVPRIQAEVANIQWPVTVEQAKFSIRFVAAAALLGMNTAEAFPARDSEIADPRVRSAIGLIEVLPMAGVDHGGAAEIEMRLKTGDVLAISLNSMVPFDDLDAEHAAVEAFAPGRVTFGVGTGSQKQEWDIGGLDWSRRFTRLDESMRFVKSIFTGDSPIEVEELTFGDDRRKYERQRPPSIGEPTLAMKIGSPRFLLGTWCSPAQLRRDEVRTSDWVPKSAYGVRVPGTGIEAKFSLPGVCALTLLGHDLTVPASFSDENVTSPAFADLIRRVELVGDPAFGEGSGEIVVETRTGTMRQPLPHTRDSKTVKSRAGLVNEKFLALAAPVIGEHAKRLRDLVADLGALPDVAGICALASRK